MLMFNFTSKILPPGAAHIEFGYNEHPTTTNQIISPLIDYNVKKLHKAPCHYEHIFVYQTTRCKRGLMYIIVAGSLESAE